MNRVYSFRHAVPATEPANMSHSLAFWMLPFAASDAALCAFGVVSDNANSQQSQAPEVVD